LWTYTARHYNVDVTQLDGALFVADQSIMAFAHTLGNPFDWAVTEFAQRTRAVADRRTAATRWAPRIAGQKAGPSSLCDYQFFPAHHITMAKAARVLTARCAMLRTLLESFFAILGFAIAGACRVCGTTPAEKGF